MGSLWWLLRDTSLLRDWSETKASLNLQDNGPDQGLQIIARRTDARLLWALPHVCEKAAIARGGFHLSGA